jgi:hypothetical protein
MPAMDPIRSLWFPVKAFTDVVGTFGPPPIGSAVAFFLSHPFAPGAAGPVAPVQLGIYVGGSQSQLQGILPFFWTRLAVLLAQGGFDPAKLGPCPPWTVATMFGEIANHVFFRYNPVGPALADALDIEAQSAVLPAALNTAVATAAAAAAAAVPAAAPIILPNAPDLVPASFEAVAAAAAAATADLWAAAGLPVGAAAQPPTGNQP